GTTKGDMRDVDRVPDGLVFERHLRVQTIDSLRQTDARSAHRVFQYDRAIGDANLPNRDRPYWTLPLRFLPFLLDETAERPAGTFAAKVDDRLIHPEAIDGQTFGDQLEGVVIKADVLDGNDLAAVDRQGDVLEFHAEEQIATQPSD